MTCDIYDITTNIEYILFELIQKLHKNLLYKQATKETLIHNPPSQQNTDCVHKV